MCKTVFGSSVDEEGDIFEHVAEEQEVNEESFRAWIKTRSIRNICDVPE